MKTSDFPSTSDQSLFYTTQVPHIRELFVIGHSTHMVQRLIELFAMHMVSAVADVGYPRSAGSIRSSIESRYRAK